jgi:putative ABC transport system permease protein
MGLVAVRQTYCICSGTIEAEERWKQMLLFASIVTIFISCVGLFGLSVFSVEKRTKEIGVRKVLGASPGVIVGLVSKDFLGLVIIALVIALVTVSFQSVKAAGANPAKALRSE